MVREEATLNSESGCGIESGLVRRPYNKNKTLRSATDGMATDA